MESYQSALYNLGKRGYAGILAIVEHTVGISAAKRFDALCRFHTKLNFLSPQTLADKVSWLSIYDLPELAVRCTDKWEVREYVRGKGMAHILIPVYGEAVSDFDLLDFSLFPESFILKATHGCKMNYVCRNKAMLDKDECRKTVEKWLKTTYGLFSVEPHYRSLPHRVYCEKLMSVGEPLTDYKFFCCNGQPTTVLVCSNRSESNSGRSEVSMNLYDMSWKPVYGIKGSGGHKAGQKDLPEPSCFKQMIDISKKLSEDFKFVRVDLYEVNGSVYFGELTFTPANGVFPSYTQEFLASEGKKLTI